MMPGSQTNKLTITEMIKRNKAAGFHWFDMETMEYFGSMIEATPNKNGIFITSEWADFHKTKRRYTLRKFDIETSNVTTIGDFLQYESLEAAREARKNIKEGSLNG